MHHGLPVVLLPEATGLPPVLRHDVPCIWAVLRFLVYPQCGIQTFVAAFKRLSTAPPLRCAPQVFRFEQAEGDAQRVLSFPALPEADRVKALLRRGTARMGLHKFEEASKDFQLVLALQPNNRQAREDLKVSNICSFSRMVGAPQQRFAMPRALQPDNSKAR